MIKLIVAYEPGRGIGLNGRMPWHIAEDLKLFKALTLGHTIVFGKTTFLGIGRVLPGRKHLIATHDASLKERFPEIGIIEDFEAFLKQNRDSEEIIYVCGGASLYRQALPYASELSLSLIHQSYPCDTHFPELDWTLYDLIAKTVYADFDHLILRRKP